MKKEQILSLLAILLAVIGLLYFTKNRPLPIPIKETTITLDHNITATRIDPPKGDTKQSDPLHLITRYQAHLFLEGELLYKEQPIPYKRIGKMVYFSLLGNLPKNVKVTVRKEVKACLIPKELVVRKEKRLYIILPKKQPYQIKPIKEDQKAYYISPPCPKEALLFKEPPSIDLPDR